MNSQDFKNQLTEKVQGILYDIDEMYDNMHIELSKEIHNKKEKQEKDMIVINKIFDKLNNEICLELVKKRLPLMVKLFNKVECRGKGVLSPNQIEIYFFFNENRSNTFQCILNIEDIKEYL